MSHTAAQVEPIPVVLTNMPAMPEARKRKLRNAIVRTLNLTAAQPIQDLVPYDTSRLYIQVQAGGNNVVICTDLSQAQDPNNQVANVPNPDGLLLPAGNTWPTRIEGCQRMWVVGNLYPAQVTYVVVHEQDD